ncbi:hypothetical protein B0T22DRAFT_532441 [Podospora appendiculata]|uniref:Uncharacterized protein n=1 Tax=Podospora appendiculata TaxID=314037 RepID=A0AAE0XGN0_9PEZI|nr:hypothetical protein B0T22DRAFT_532441 [Podospora appendiculata]
MSVSVAAASEVATCFLHAVCRAQITGCLLDKTGIKSNEDDKPRPISPIAFIRDKSVDKIGVMPQSSTLEVPHVVDRASRAYFLVIIYTLSRCRSLSRRWNKSE